MATVHQPILLKPIVEALIDPFLKLPLDSGPHSLVDCTLGGGGHTAAFLEAFASRPELRHHQVISLDQDLKSLQEAQVRFKNEITSGGSKFFIPALEKLLKF
jgi:16S rRNA C1402 N4-methylase RsmH